MLSNLGRDGHRHGSSNQTHICACQRGTRKRPPTRGGFFRTRHTCGAEAELIETLARAAGDWWDMSKPHLADALVQALPVPPSREELLACVRDVVEAAC